MKFLKQLVARVMRHQLSKFDEFYQRNSGEECYIFGNGPSLKWMDLHQFTDRPAIAVNLLLFHKEASVLRIPYCALIETYWFWRIMYDGPTCKPMFCTSHYHAQQEFRRLIVQNPKTIFFLNITNYPVARYPNAVYVSRWYTPPFVTKNLFRENLDYPYSSFEFQIALAVYLGYKKAYLIGSDKTHVPSRGRHFYDKGEGTWENVGGYCREFLNYAKQYIDLVTVTLDGVSETMDFITYKELTGKDPVFRENTEIVDMAKLESLAKMPNLSIF